MSSPPARLGRGLASLLGDMSSGFPPASAPVGEIAVDDLEANPFQPRRQFDPASMTELAESIQRQGVLQPLLVRPHPTAGGRYQIIAGERRWRAARQAGVTTIPCYIRSLDDSTVTAAALVENLQRRDLNPIEEATGYRRLMSEFAMTQDGLSASIGKSRSHVANTLRLLQLPEAVQAHLLDGTLTAGHARAALASADPERAAAAMIANGLNVRQAEALAAGSATRPPRPKPPGRGGSNPDLKAVEADLAETLGLTVSISFDGRGGSVKLQYQSLDQLDHIIARLGRTPY